MFERHGFTVLTCTDSREGAGIAIREPIDLLITDYTMPDMNGDEIVALVRRFKRNLPIIMVSGSPDAHNPNVDAFIVKGDMLPALRFQVDRLLEEGRTVERV